MIARLLKSRSGASAIEYALIAGVMAVALVAGASTIGPSLAAIFLDVVAAF